MPVTKEIFESGLRNESESHRGNEIIKFLRKNSNMAYSTTDLCNEFKNSYSTTRKILRLLARKGKLRFKLLGATKYYMIREAKQ